MGTISSFAHGSTGVIDFGATSLVYNANLIYRNEMDLLESEVFSDFCNNMFWSICSSSFCASVLSGLLMGQHHIVKYLSSEVFCGEAVFRRDEAAPGHVPLALRVEGGNFSHKMASGISPPQLSWVFYPTTLRIYTRCVRFLFHLGSGLA